VVVDVRCGVLTSRGVAADSNARAILAPDSGPGVAQPVGVKSDVGVELVCASAGMSRGSGVADAQDSSVTPIRSALGARDSPVRQARM
jgi:hypothetical protein